jgi:hypothetical protein
MVVRNGTSLMNSTATNANGDERQDGERCGDEEDVVRRVAECLLEDQPHRCRQPRQVRDRLAARRHRRLVAEVGQPSRE